MLLNRRTGPLQRLSALGRILLKSPRNLRKLVTQGPDLIELVNLLGSRILKSFLGASVVQPTASVLKWDALGAREGIIPWVQVEPWAGEF